MKILLAASEVAPIIKIGGLGDVIGSLPKALAALNVKIDVIVPYFAYANLAGYSLYKSIELAVPFNGQTYTVEVVKTTLPNSDVNVILLKNARYFGATKPNFYANNAAEIETFTFFSRCIAEYVKAEFNTYDLVHCNDWHTGLVTHILKEELDDNRPATLFTIHNIMYQGIASTDTINESGLTPGQHATLDWDAEDGYINLMEQGIISSDYVNTVSPTYAQEILLKEYSGALSELLQARVGRLTGILNGIDYTQFPRSYDKETAAFAKSNAKTNLQTELKLNVDNDFPLLSYIGRLDANQKGLDLIYAAVPSLVAAGGQFVLLGTGDAAWSSKFKELEHRFPGNVSVNILFDEAFSHDIYSASDFILIPSKYEPCGLVQMLAMWYGALPIVHYVGGLKDTVEDAVTGFCYHDQSNGTFSAAINRAVALFKTPASLDNMRKNAMSADWSWKRSAKDYLNLYHKIISLRGER